MATENRAGLAAHHRLRRAQHGNGVQRAAGVQDQTTFAFAGSTLARAAAPGPCGLAATATAPGRPAIRGDPSEPSLSATIGL